MTQTHSQIKLTPKPINLDDVISFVAADNLAFCSYKGLSKKSTNISDSKALDAQATMAQMELDAIALSISDEFDVSHIAIHFRLGNVAPNDVNIAFAISSQSSKECDLASEQFIAKLNGSSTSWKQQILAEDHIWVKSN